MRSNEMSVARVAATSSVAGEVRIGDRVRTRRKELKLSVNQLAERAGLSVGIVGQLERGRANPSLRTLERICTALDVPLTSLVEDQVRGTDHEALYVRRSNDRPLLTIGKGGIAKQLLSSRGGEVLRFMTIAMPPKSKNEEVLMGPGEKAGWILQGEMTLVIGGDSIILREEDTFQFPSNIPHSIFNHSEREARLLWIMTTPREVMPL